MYGLVIIWPGRGEFSGTCKISFYSVHFVACSLGRVDLYSEHVIKVVLQRTLCSSDNGPKTTLVSAMKKRLLEISTTWVILELKGIWLP